MTTFYMGPKLEPLDDAIWHLHAEAYATSGDEEEEALDWLSDADLDDEQLATVRDWFRASAKYATAIEDRIAGVR